MEACSSFDPNQNLEKNLEYLKGHEDDLTLFYQCTMLVHMTYDTDQALSLCAKHLLHKTGADTVFLYLWDSEVEELLPLCIEAQASISSGLRRLIRELVQQCHQKREPFGLSGLPSTFDRNRVPEELHCALVLPIHIEDEMIGTLGFLNLISQMSPRHIESLQLATGIFLTAIQQLYQTQEITRQHRELVTVNQRLENTLRELERRQSMVEARASAFNLSHQHL